MTRTTLSALLAAALAAAALPGCVVYPGTARPTTWDELRREEGWTLLDTVPFVAQRTEQDCGAASLAMVLARWGVDAPPEEIERECAEPGQDGLKASALRDAVRRRGLKAFVFAGRVEDLEHELALGRPVVVGLVKSIGPLVSSHFEVVVGLQPASGGNAARQIAALDPFRGLVRDSLDGFRGEWEATKGVTLVIFKPGAGPVALAAGGP